MNRTWRDRGSTHLAFVRDEPLREIVAGSKRFEIRASFRGLACASVRKGDMLLLKRVGGAVEAACEVGDVRIYWDAHPAYVVHLTHRYADATSRLYLRRYVPPRNRDRPVNVAIIGLLNVLRASLPAEAVPHGVRSGWVTGFHGHDHGRSPYDKELGFDYGV